MSQAPRSVKSVTGLRPSAGGNKLRAAAAAKGGREVTKEEAVSDAPVRLTPAPEGYADWLADLKGRIHAAQQRATLAVNRELVLLYWRIGRNILARQAVQGWGVKVIERLAQDLRESLKDPYRFDFLGISREAGEQVKHPQDAPTIGLLLCKSKNKVVAEYALRDSAQPMGIAEFKLLESLPAELQTSLPSIEQIERELAGGDTSEQNRTK